MRYGFRPYRGSLKESLKLSVYISKQDFYSLLYNDLTYDFYCFDNRCNQLLFINKDCDWLFIELDNYEKVGLKYE